MSQETSKKILTLKKKSKLIKKFMTEKLLKCYITSSAVFKK